MASRSRLDEILDLYEYDAWASKRVLEAASGLSHAQLTREVGGSFPSVLLTLKHILSSNWVWLSRWNGASPSGWPGEWTIGDFRGLVEHWRRVHEERRAYLAGLGEADLDRVVEYRNTKGEPYRSAMVEMLRHVVNHASYHRGQVTNQLRMVGGTPANTDLIAWYRQRGGAQDGPDAVAAPRDAV